MNFLEFLQNMPVIGILRDIPRGEEEACITTAASCGPTAPSAAAPIRQNR